jgi:hypothetical protein
MPRQDGPHDGFWCEPGKQGKDPIERHLARVSFVFDDFVFPTPGCF